MSELIDFAARLIELEGGASEPRPDGLSALLPPSLSERWQLPEELQLSDREQAPHRLAYGTELLERIIDTATVALSATHVQLELDSPRPAQLQRAAEGFALRNGLSSPSAVRIGPQTRLELYSRARLDGDEQREFVMPIVVSAWSGTEVGGYADGLRPDFLTGTPLAEPLPDAVLTSALRVAARRCEELAGGFREAMTRRFERDRGRIEAYFQDLQAELAKRAARGKLEPAAVESKRHALAAERHAKLTALEARFVLRIAVEPIALRVVQTQGAFASVLLRRRKAQRTLELEYDAWTRRLVPPRCEDCGFSAPRPAACDDALHLLCEVCAPRAEGRLSCAACKPTRSPRTLEPARRELANPG